MRVLPMCLCLLFLCSACTKTTKPLGPKAIDPEVLTTITNVTQSGVSLALFEWAKKNPAAAKECATNLSSNLTQQLLPYFQGQAKLKTAAEVQQFLQTSLCDKLPVEVRVAIVACFGIVDKYLPIPDDKTYLNQDQINLIVALLTGIRNGCDQFGSTTEANVASRTANAPDAKKADKSRWVK